MMKMRLDKDRIGQQERHSVVQAKGLFILFALLLVTAFFTAIPFSALAAASQPTDPTSTCDNKATSACTVCVSKTNFSAPNAGEYMISQMFKIINGILDKIQSTFYTGIVGNSLFQKAIGVAFLLYIGAYGFMIMFNLASFRSNEVSKRLVKLAIVYMLTTTGGWTFFSTWIQNPVVGEMNQIITFMANTGTAGGSGSCVTAGSFSSGAPVTYSSGGPTPDTSLDVTLSTGPMAMLYGPMTCTFGSKFISTVEGLIKTGFYGWILSLLLLFGLLEFSMMILGAIITYVKAIIGLTFLFGIAPIFIAFYLFEKTRTLTEGWISMVIGHAVQPIMLFAFLAFYAGIVGGALNNLFTDASGSGQQDLCYVPWYTMSGLFHVYWWSFVNGSGAAGGNWMNAGTGGSGSGGIGSVANPPVQVINILYFLILASLGKNFTNYINQLSTELAGGSGGGVTTPDSIGSWFQNNVTGGRGPVSSVANVATKTASGLRSIVRPSTN